ncbi:MAG: mobile mystery protein A [Proteobacteria bacterium]|nr:mobile mystery protein A [Pseudomonadota bacterium]
MNTFKKIEQEQNALIVDSAATLMRSTTPKLGWIKTLRMALSMSGASLARRMGIQRSSVASLEQAEYDGGITLRKLKQVADAMDCELIYYLVPKTTPSNSKPMIGDIMLKQAQIKANNIVQQASTQMMLESQQLTKVDLKKEVDRLTSQLTNDLPKDFWELD